MQNKNPLTLNNMHWNQQSSTLFTVAVLHFSLTNKSYIQLAHEGTEC